MRAASVALSVVLLMSITATGARAQEFIWAKQLAGDHSVIPAGMVLDASGSTYTVGAFEGTGDFDPGSDVYSLTSAGLSDIFISKLDVGGRFVWSKSLGGPGNDAGLSVALDAAGNVYTTGSFSGTVDFDPGPDTYNLTSVGLADIFVSKLDANGNFVWARSAGGAGVLTEAISMATDNAGNVYTTGYFQGTVDFDPGPDTYYLTSAGLADIFVSKLDANSGSFIWARSMAGTSDDYGWSVAVDGAGNVYTTGYYQGTVDFDPGPGTNNLTSAGLADIFISKLDTSGSLVWAKSMGGAANDWAYSIGLDGTGNVYTTGGIADTADFDPGPGVYKLTSAGNWDFFVCKLDPGGNFLWANSRGETEDDFPYSIAMDGAGNVYTTGYFQGTVDFDPGLGVDDLTSAGEQDIFVSKLDSYGGSAWAKSMGGTSIDVGSSIAVDGSGNVYVAGRFHGTADFNPGPGTYNLTSTGLFDGFVVKLGFDNDGDGISDDSDECPHSVLTSTVVIGTCDSGVQNHLFPSGCSFSDLIAGCRAGAPNHGQFVSCVSHLTNDWKESGLITGREKGQIERCAAQEQVDDDDGHRIGRPKAAPAPVVAERVPGGVRLTFAAELGEPRDVAIYDVTGRKVRSLDLDGGSGAREILWDGRSNDSMPVPEGVYFVRFLGTGRSLTTKVVLIR